MTQLYLYCSNTRKVFVDHRGAVLNDLAEAREYTTRVVQSFTNERSLEDWRDWVLRVNDDLGDELYRRPLRFRARRAAMEVAILAVQSPIPLRRCLVGINRRMRQAHRDCLSSVLVRASLARRSARDRQTGGGAVPRVTRWNVKTMRRLMTMLAAATLVLGVPSAAAAAHGGRQLGSRIRFGGQPGPYGSGLQHHIWQQLSPGYGGSSHRPSCYFPQELPKLPPWPPFCN